jgi:hypothetical protein
MKGLHLYNEPSFFDAMYALFSPLMKQKTKDRVSLYLTYANYLRLLAECDAENNILLLQTESFYYFPTFVA